MVLEILSLKKKKITKKGWQGVAQEKCLPNKPEALGSNPYDKKTNGQE
jgi:hypothetical protein